MTPPLPSPASVDEDQKVYTYDQLLHLYKQADSLISKQEYHIQQLNTAVLQLQGLNQEQTVIIETHEQLDTALKEEIIDLKQSLSFERGITSEMLNGLTYLNTTIDTLLKKKTQSLTLS